VIGKLHAAIRANHEIGKELRGLLFFEFRTVTGHAHGEPRWIDAFHIGDVPSTGFVRTAYEVKVTRADFLREINDPLKRRAAMRISNRFFFVTPPGVAKPEEIPLGCGLLEVHEDGRRDFVVDAPFRDSLRPSWALFVAFARGVGKLPNVAEGQGD